jgi:hypothetical protein
MHPQFGDSKMTNAGHRELAKALLWLMLLSASLLGACTVKLISDYDPQTDQALTALQRKMETFFVDLEDKIGTEQAEYRYFEDFYDEVRVDISAIRLRASALPKNEITLEQVVRLEENIGLLEEVHEEGIGSVEVVQVIREDFNTALSNILRLELAKKRGEAD